MKLLKYIMPFDTGLAPNPFGRWCTLAVCSPNHLNARLESGDWIVGHGGINEGYKLIYAMEVTEIMCFDDYYNDRRFNYKKPVIGGKWWQISGDNIYYRDDDGNYTFDINPLHKYKFETDTNNPKVFISNNYYYFGENAIEEFPQLFPFLVNNVRRFTYEKNENNINTFITWLKKKYKRGRNGNKPTDPVREPGC